MQDNNSTAKPRVLVVEDERLNINILVSILVDDYDVVIAKNGAHAIKRVEDQEPDLVLLDIMLPDMDGYEVYERIQAIASDKIPVIFVTSKRTPEEEIKGLQLGAVDYITKPFTPSIIDVRIANQIEAKKNRDELKRMNNADPLTGLSNRRHMDEFLTYQLPAMLRTKSPMSVIMIDIDFFKQYNDNYGHTQGDKCLKKVAGILASQVNRATDLVARYGGEEFVVVMPATDESGAESIAEKMRIAILDAQIAHENSEVADQITISLGVSSLNPEKTDTTIEQLLESADKALYRAKQRGRNLCQLG